MKICVLDRGWVAVGNLEKDGSYYLLCNASFIRRWGTTQGLGEIAKDGPTKDTILDKTPMLKFHESHLIFTISCNEEKWK